MGIINKKSFCFQDEGITSSNSHTGKWFVFMQLLSSNRVQIQVSLVSKFEMHHCVCLLGVLDWPLNRFKFEFC